MNDSFFEGQTFSHLKKPEPGAYDSCRFINCDFSGADLSDIKFLDCEFSRCNFGLAKLTGASFRDARFLNCKLLGLHFEDCDNLIISFEFDGCTLDLSSFCKLKLKRTKFKNSKIIEVDFTDSDLSNSIFDNCDLQRTIFRNTNLENADFRTSFNYSIDPEVNKIKKAKFSLLSVSGLLDKYDIEIEK